MAGSVQNYRSEGLAICTIQIKRAVQLKTYRPDRASSLRVSLAEHGEHKIRFDAKDADCRGRQQSASLYEGASCTEHF
jgi:hypothetical protein